MPCILKISIIEGRDLPIMDRSSALADAYVEIRCGPKSDVQKTDIQKKTLNPVWNQDFRFDFTNEGELQDKPLDIRVWDYDLVSKNDMIGTVLIDLNCLLDQEETISQISGWFPIYDTLRGIRGELSITIHLEKFQNANPFKESSDGIQFFSISTPFSNYRISKIHSFVEELIVENDPEYHWTDTFKASRFSNFERQHLLYTLTGKLRRQLGKKVQEMGGNAVLGFKQHFDFEGDSGIVARGYGTAVTLRKINETDLMSPFLSPKHFIPSILNNNNNNDSDTSSSSSKTSTDKSRHDNGSDSEYSSSETSDSTLSDSESIKGSLMSGTTDQQQQQQLVDEQKPKIDKHPIGYDVQLLTLQSFQSRLIVHVGGIVSTKSVKILKKSNSQEMRDAYWAEIRHEIKSHARSLGCNFVVGYTETTTIQQSEDLCIFSATGTAVILDLDTNTKPSNIATNKLLISDDVSDDIQQGSGGSYKKSMILSNVTVGGSLQRKRSNVGSLSGSIEDVLESIENIRLSKQTQLSLITKKKPSLPRAKDGCHICHIPYSQSSIPAGSQFVKCSMCRKRYVPEVLLATIEPPPGIPITGIGHIIQAKACRIKKKAQGEANSIQLSDALPFIEYELHNQLMYQLKLHGMNAAFSLRVQITFSDTLVIGIATATAVHLSALPAPPILHISRSLLEINQDERTRKIYELHTKMEEKSKFYHFQISTAPIRYQPDTFELYNTFTSKQKRSHQNQPLSPTHNDNTTATNTTAGEESMDSSFELSKSDSLQVDKRKSSRELKSSKSSKREKLKRSSKSKSSGKLTKSPSVDSSSSDEEFQVYKKRNSKKSNINTSKEKSKSHSQPSSTSKSKLIQGYSSTSKHKKLPKTINESEDHSTSPNLLSSSSDFNEITTTDTQKEDYSTSSGESEESDDTEYYRKSTSRKNLKKSQKSNDTIPFSSNAININNVTTNVTNNNNINNGTPSSTGANLSFTPNQHLRKTTSISSSSDSDDGISSFQPERISESSNAYMVEIDKMDEDKIKTLLGLEIPQNFQLCNTELLPGQSKPSTSIQLITAIRRVEWDVDPVNINTQLTLIFSQLYESILFKLRGISPCQICGLKFDISIPEEDQLQILLTATCGVDYKSSRINDNPFFTPLQVDASNSNPLIPPPPISLTSSKVNIPSTILVPTTLVSNSNSILPSIPPLSMSQSHPNISTHPLHSQPVIFKSSSNLTTSLSENNNNNNQLTEPTLLTQEQLQFDMSPPKSPLRKTFLENSNFPVGNSGGFNNTGSTMLNNLERINELLGSRSIEQKHVELTPLSFLPPANKLEKYLGRVSVHLIKESFSVREQGGLGVFGHVFLKEANAIVRAQVKSMGGNTLLGYNINEFNLILDSGPKGQAYSLFSISGDAFYSTGELFGILNNVQTVK